MALTAKVVGPTWRGLATAVSIIVGSGCNITFLLSLAFLVAASANLPVILLTLVA